jgi:hypothetical protein
MALDSNISPENGYYDSDFRGFPQSVQATATARLPVRYIGAFRAAEG